MFENLKSLFSKSPSIDFKQLMLNGATIVDVRSQGEYAGGHIPKSLNIPVDSLKRNLSFLKDRNKPIITCCASGVRSAMAKNILKEQGYTNVHNGGSWGGLQNKIK